jgi:glycerate kinase
VVVLDRALAHMAAVVARDIGVYLRDEPGAGAAGGLGFGLMAFLGAHVRPGVDVVADALGLHARMAGADLTITGEGRLDGGSLRGKVPGGILGLGRELSVPVAIVCGDVEPGLPSQGVAVVSLVERFGRDVALGDARRSLERLAQELATRADELVGNAEGTGQR